MQFGVGQDWKSWSVKKGVYFLQQLRKVLRYSCPSDSKLHSVRWKKIFLKLKDRTRHVTSIISKKDVREVSVVSLCSDNLNSNISEVNSFYLNFGLTSDNFQCFIHFYISMAN